MSTEPFFDAEDRKWINSFLGNGRRVRFRPICETVELPPFPQQLCDQQLPAKGQE